jgi:hypothetical protein
MWATADDIRPTSAVEHCVAALLGNSSAVMLHGPILVRLEGQLDLVERADEAHLADWEVAERARAFTKGIPHNGWCTACSDDPLSRVRRLRPALGKPVSCICKRAFWAHRFA